MQSWIDRSFRSFQADLFDNIHLISQYFLTHVILEVYSKSQYKCAQKGTPVKIALLDVVTYLILQIFYPQFYLLAATYQPFFAAFHFLATFFYELLKITCDFCFSIDVLIVEALEVFDQGQAVMPLDIVQSTTFIHYPHLFIFLFISFCILIYSISRSNISKMQRTLRTDHLVKHFLVLVNAAQVNKKEKIGKIICCYQIYNVRDDEI